ncbi:MAG TPA: AAA family ATPase, partial [Puia sp.]
MLFYARLFAIGFLLSFMHSFSSESARVIPSLSAAAQPDEPKIAKEKFHEDSNSVKTKQESSSATPQQVGEQKKSKEEAAVVALPITTPEFTASYIDQVIKSAPQEVQDFVKLLESKDSLSDEHSARKLLLVGQPGTGKTTLAKVIAAKCKMPYLIAKATLISTEYQNSGDQNLKRIFEKARSLNQPCIVIIDELQALMQKHTNSKDSGSTMLTSLWTLLDDYAQSPILFIGTLNYTE